MRRRRQRGSGTWYFDRASKVWIARYPLGGGKYVRRRCATETLARQELDNLARLHNRDIATGTLDDYLAQWISTKVDVRESTRVSYATHINKHISPLLGGIQVARLRPSDVRRLVADRLAHGLAPATVRRVHSTLHAALEQGVRDRSLADNVARGIGLPRVEEHLVEAMTPADADAIRGAVEGTYLEPLIELLLGSGMRLGEALGLNQGDLHLDEGYVTVRVSKTRQRAVDISDDAADALRHHLTTLKVRGKAEPVFWGIRGAAKRRRLRGTTVSHAFPKMLTAAGLDRLNVHGTRHGAASLLLAGGASMKEVSEQLGHKSVSTTDHYYAHIARSRLRDNVRLLNRRKA